MSCSTGCYEIQIEACEDFTLKVGLAASAPYYVVLRKPGSRNIFQKLLTAEEDGSIKVLKSDFPDGYFAAGNFFKVEIREGNNYTTITPVIVSGVSYTCILLETVVINTIPA